MTRRPLLILAFITIYIFGIATPYLVRYPLALIRPSISGVKEFSRQTSPDGVLDAVVIQDNPGAFSSYLYDLYLVPKGAKAEGISADSPIVDTSEGDAITVNWEKPHFLTVSTGDSHVRFFGNLWYSKRTPDYYVELTLSTAGRHYLRENGKLRGQ
jgi:hypothetical protein